MTDHFPDDHPLRRIDRFLNLNDIASKTQGRRTHLASTPWPSSRSRPRLCDDFVTSLR